VIVDTPAVGVVALFIVKYAGLISAVAVAVAIPTLGAAMVTTGGVLYCVPDEIKSIETTDPNPLTLAIASAVIPLGPVGELIVTIGGFAEVYPAPEDVTLTRITVLKSSPI
jgi:hypothetical protein